MKKVLLIVLITIFAIAGSGCGVSSQEPEVTETVKNPAEVFVTEESPEAAQFTGSELDYINLTYDIEGKPVTLVEGISEVEAAPGSASKIVTQIFGNEVFGDLNGDEKEDAAVLITSSGSGNGTFFYIAAALQTDAGLIGTNAILLGDRIAPQTTQIAEGQILVNYADRKPDEPFTAQPSVGITRIFEAADGKLVEVYNISQITNRIWKWESTRMNDDTVILPVKADVFTIQLHDDGNVSITTDCNNYTGKYSTEDFNKLSFELSSSATSTCGDSQETDFIKSLSEISGLMIAYPENQLVLLLKYDVGSMIFK